MDRKKYHLKYVEVPNWVLDRFSALVGSVGGRREFREKFGISESYMSLLLSGKRHIPEALHPLMGIKLVITPMRYEEIEK
jgi:hypothetical protein